MRVDGGNGEDRSLEKYCLDCPWALSENEVDSDEELSRRTLEHFVETGHTIESVDQVLPPPSNGD